MKNIEQLLDEFANYLLGDDAQKLIEKRNEITSLFNRQWIPVSEKLPEIGERVLSMSEFGIQIAWLNQRSLWTFPKGVMAEQEAFTHWMPLPSLPPEPVKEENHIGDTNEMVKTYSIEELEEKIKTIMEFDGWKQKEISGTLYWDKIGKNDRIKVAHSVCDATAYHSDWTWLHSVWEKLHIKLTEIIDAGEYIDDKAIHYNNLIAYKVSFSHKPLEAFNALYEGIVFINEKNKPA